MCNFGKYNGNIFLVNLNVTLPSLEKKYSNRKYETSMGNFAQTSRILLNGFEI